MTSRGGTFSANYNTDDSGERTPTSDVQPTTQTPGLLSGEEYFTDASEPSEPSEICEPNETQMVDQQMIDTPKTRELSLSKPMPFNGERFKSKKFLQECILYMGINKDVYDTEPKCIAFILSYMQEGNAVVWKQQFVQNKLNLDMGDVNLLTYREFINEFQKAFKPEEEDIDALDKLKMLQQKNLTAEQLVTKFKLLVGEAEMSNDSDTANKLLIEMFKTALNPALVQKIIQSEKRPTKIEEWYDKAMSFYRSYRLAMAIQGPSQSNARFIPRSAPKKDPFTMDVDVMTTEERTSLMKKEAYANKWDISR
ncbi:LOW QUALITY PROTEIN: hypothetical protein CVT25_014269 [Psilocybe cyanescens]|uniref:Ty3 transposon capsid-like protein domain-containing protein n=1 Tax=Psilocybe cyanescens TaxID=93625 RepID=A0A409XKX7_PSICY|nr:LOW QUALITY PROTEIN: hypothetical protein CVT25_014269 [Psilocybe cyanescens]